MPLTLLLLRALCHALQPLFDDYELVAEYIDAIRQLTTAVKSEKADKDTICALSDHVLYVQRVRMRMGAAACVLQPLPSCYYPLNKFWS